MWVQLVFCVLAVARLSSSQSQLPKEMLMGYATASYQVEGGWDVDGKGANIWDTLTHMRPEGIIDGTNGDVATDSYHKYKEDVQLLKNMNADIYRFSISWARILPNGDLGTINQPGIDYYNNLINELLANGIQPMVTLYHWDLPQKLQDIGGWPNPLLVDYFVDYARLAFQNFGDRVKWWLTFNEPIMVTETGYSGDILAPALNLSYVGGYLAGHTLLKAHAATYHMYVNEFKASQKGKVGMAMSSFWCEPKTNSTADIQAARDGLDFLLGWFAQPVHGANGDYPAVMRKNIDSNSKEEGRTRSRLPYFTKEEVKYIQGTWDFFGINTYTTIYVTPGKTGGWWPTESINRDAPLVRSFDPSWPDSGSDWLKVVPWGFRKLLNYIKTEYGNPPIFVTENGYADKGELEDDKRIQYYSLYLDQLSKAIYEDDVNVIGYTAWSLIDNFEWSSGYTEKFGVYNVDFNDPDRPRTPKKSVPFMKAVYKTRTVPAAGNLK